MSKLVTAMPALPLPSKSADIHSHPGTRLAIVAERHPGFEADVPESSVPQVAIQLVRLRVVGDEEIGPAVLIDVEHGDAERLRARIEDAAVWR